MQPTESQEKNRSGRAIELLLMAALLFGMASFIYYFIVWRGWVLFNGDASALYFPGKAFLYSSLKNLQVPLWTSHLFLGFPFFAEAQAGVLYPIHLLLTPFKTTTAYSIATFTRYIMAGLFMFLFIRRITGRSLAAAISGLVFAYNGYMIAQAVHENVEHALIWLPLILLALDRWIFNGHRPALIAAGICLGISFLAGYFFISLLVLITASCYYICLSLFAHKDNTGSLDTGYFKAWTGGLAAFGLIGVGLACIQILPNYELAQVSVRAGGLDYAVSTQVSLSPFHLVCFIFPKFFGHPSVGDVPVWGLWASNYIDLVFYMGILPFFFILGALFLRRDRYTLFFGLMFLISLGLALGQFSPLWYLLHNLPVFSMMRNPARFLSMTVTAGAVLAGLGFDRLIRHEQLNARSLDRYLRVIGAGTGLIITLSLLSGWIVSTARPYIRELGQWFVEQFVHNQSIHDKPLAHYLDRLDIQYDILASIARIDHPVIYWPVILLSVSVPLLWYLAKSSRNIQTAGLCCVAFIGLDLYALAHNYNFELPPEAYNRKPGFIEVIEQDDSPYRYAFSPLQVGLSNYNPMIFKQDYIQGSSPLQLGRHAELLEALRPHMMELSEAVTLNPLVNLMNIRYIVAYDSVAYSWSKLLSRTDVYVYENKTALPRAFIAAEAHVLPTAGDVLRTLTDTTFVPEKTVLLEAPATTVPASSDTTPATARIVKYDHTEIEIETAGGGGYLVLTDTYYPGWTAYVDGEETPVLRADYLFRAVPIDAGRHTVRFVYTPWSFRIGAGISLLTLMISAALIFMRRKRMS